MPEGDTIYRTARALQKALGGRVVTGFEAALAKLVSGNDDRPVVGRVVERVEARGKWCLIFFSGDLILVSHMLMSGSWHIYSVGERWRLPRKMMRVVVRVGAPPGLKPLASLGGFSDGTEVLALPSQSRSPSGMTSKNDTGGLEAVLFNAQVAEFHTARSLARSAQVPKLGPDVLATEFSMKRGVEALQEYAAKHPAAEVGQVLLNQRVMAGLGNVYKSEVAFAAGVHPFRAVAGVSVREMERMVEAAQRYMKANVQEGAGEGIVTYAGNRRTTRAMNAGDRLWVYGRKGQECRRCGAEIVMRKQGAGARTTYWCPECQKAGEGG